MDSPSKLSTTSTQYVIRTVGSVKTLIGYIGNSSKLSLPDDITDINQYAFYNNKKIYSVVIPNGVTNIGYNAFSDCYNLVEVYNLSSLDITTGSVNNGHIGYYALDIYTSAYDMSKLHTSSDNYLIHRDGNEYTLIRYNGNETQLTLPYNITNIYQYAFRDNEKITSVAIPDSVTSIDYGAFYNCIGLVNVTIGNSVKSIGSDVFIGCSSLGSIFIPASVTSIGNGTFWYCSSLSTIEFEAPHGWYYTGSYNNFISHNNGVAIEFPDSTDNAINFRYYFGEYYFYKD